MPRLLLLAAGISTGREVALLTGGGGMLLLLLLVWPAWAI
jgi:hypothetical protein